MANQSKRNPLSWLLGAMAILFSATLTTLIHDSLALNQNLSDDELRQMVSESRPVLFDHFGHPLKLNSDQDYVNALQQGRYRANPDSTIAMISSHHSLTLINVDFAPTALMEGWTIAPLDQELGLVLQTKQSQKMWLGDSSTLWFESALCFIFAIVLLGGSLLTSFNLEWVVSSKASEISA
jgi:hypothetical protein